MKQKELEIFIESNNDKVEQTFIIKLTDNVTDLDDGDGKTDLTNESVLFRATQTC